MKRSHNIQVGAAVAGFATSALLSMAIASAGPVGGIVNGAGGAVGGVVNGAGGAVGGAVNGTAGTIGGAVNGTVNGGPVNGTLNGTTNTSVNGTNANSSTNVNGSGSVGNALNASFAGSTDANASASTPALPNASKAMQTAYTTMQKERSAKQLVFQKAEQIKGTVTNAESKYVSFVSQKGLTYVAAVNNTGKNVLTKGSHILANSTNYGQNVQLTLDSSVSQNSSNSTAQTNTGAGSSK